MARIRSPTESSAFFWLTTTSTPMVSAPMISALLISNPLSHNAFYVQISTDGAMLVLHPRSKRKRVRSAREFCNVFVEFLGNILMYKNNNRSGAIFSNGGMYGGATRRRGFCHENAVYISTYSRAMISRARRSANK